MVTVVKCGGGAGIDADRVCGDVAQLVAAGQPVVLVHGGAGEIDRLAAQLGLARRTLVLSAGTTSRYNDPATVDALTMAMTGRVKPRLLRALAARGVPAVGLTGLDAGLLVARRKAQQRAQVDGRTMIVRDDLSGRIVAVGPTLPRLLLDAGMVPVVSPPAAGEDGQPLNVDADRAAAALAVALGAARLVLLTAAPGVVGDGPAPLPGLELPAAGPVQVGWSAGMRRKLTAARDALAGAMAELGLDAHVDQAGNLVGRTGTGTGPSLLLLGHMDTVDRPLPVRRDGGRLYGRGAADAKGPLAAMVCAAAARPDFPGTLRVAGSVEEERRSGGAAHLVGTLPAPDLLVVGEPSGWSSVVLGYKGKLDLEYRVERPSTHSTNPAAKAGELAVAFWLALLEQLGPELDHARFDRPAATLRAIDGDMLAATLTADCRLPPGFDPDRFLAALGERADGGTVRVLHHVPAVRADRTNAIARSLSAAIRRHGGTPRPKLKTGTADMNLVAAAWPIPMAAYGPGDSTLDHTDDEHVEVEEYLRAVAVLTTALDELAPGLTTR